MENLSTPQPQTNKLADNTATNLILPSVGQQLTYPLDHTTQEILRDFMRTMTTQLPIGSIYMNKTNSANPSTYLGYGTWTAIEGYVVAGYKSGDPNFGTAGVTIGSATHTLTVAELPAHDHVGNSIGGTGVGVFAWGTVAGNTALEVTGSTGLGDAHNNIQPTLVAYVWERTA